MGMTLPGYRRYIHRKPPESIGFVLGASLNFEEKCADCHVRVDVGDMYAANRRLGARGRRRFT